MSDPTPSDGRRIAPGALLAALAAGLVFLPAGLTYLAVYLTARLGRVRTLTLAYALIPLTLIALATGAPDPFALVKDQATGWLGLAGGGAFTALWTGHGWWLVLAGALAAIITLLFAHPVNPDEQRSHVHAWFKARKLHEHIRENAFPDRLTLGVDETDPTVRVSITSAPGKHQLVTGATGAGKTQALFSELKDAVAQGHPVLYLDLKGADDVAEYLAGLADEYGRPFQHFSVFDATGPYYGPSPDGPATYNPAAHGDATRRQNLLTKACGSTVEFYKNMTQDYVQWAFRTLLAADRLKNESALHAIREVMDPNVLLKLARTIPATSDDAAECVAKASEFVKEMNIREFASSLKTFRTYLSLLTGSTVGPFITGGKNVIDFHQLDHTSGILCISLNSAVYPDLAARLATLMVEDLTTYAGERGERAATPFRLIVDEFSAIDSNNLLNLLARGRSKGMNVTIATQTLADMDPQFRSQVINNVETFVVFRCNSADDATEYSNLTGTLTSREGVDVLWQEFQNLPQGRCILINKTPQTSRVGLLRREVTEPAVTRVRVVMRVTNPVETYTVHARDLHTVDDLDLDRPVADETVTAFLTGQPLPTLPTLGSAAKPPQDPDVPFTGLQFDKQP